MALREKFIYPDGWTVSRQDWKFCKSLFKIHGITLQPEELNQLHQKVASGDTNFIKPIKYARIEDHFQDHRIVFKTTDAREMPIEKILNIIVDPQNLSRLVTVLEPYQPLNHCKKGRKNGKKFLHGRSKHLPKPDVRKPHNWRTEIDFDDV